eukprot:gnl/MRDRNA2_/MRDRNA2_127902_c0_seq1.p1 gnl/MRDRNA2_/MRDRNA2_127902_c0~~gnl/MRDRNA2_/MRDRNA2_127902_c0_seq1.p1  ORF type:complete len:114 (-),score=12.12 gnl/MRDRNA2_/MRDRNA2_127902_c0_seq1:106-447(-)
MASDEEYFAFHADHVHEPAYSKKHTQVQHVSVANRLTVSRFRHLMSTPSGQHFLNQNLHRTAVLSSDPSVCSPRPTLASTLRNDVANCRKPCAKVLQPAALIHGDLQHTQRKR